MAFHQVLAQLSDAGQHARLPVDPRTLRRCAQLAKISLHLRGGSTLSTELATGVVGCLVNLCNRAVRVCTCCSAPFLALRSVIMFAGQLVADIEYPCRPLADFAAPTRRGSTTRT